MYFLKNPLRSYVFSYKVIVILSIFAYYFFLTTGGSYKLFVTEHHCPDTFDIQAKSISNFSLITPSACETFRGLNGPVIYQGILPSIIRMPVLFFYPNLFGKLSRASCFLAITLIIICIELWVSGIVRNSRLKTKGVEPSKSVDIIAWTTAFTGTLAATPLIYLSSSASIYHEVILWGATGATWAYYGLFKAFTGTNTKEIRTGILISAASVVITLLSRVTFALGPLICLSYLLLLETFKPLVRTKITSSHEKRLLGFSYLILILGAVIISVTNYARWGNIFTAIDVSKYVKENGPPLQAYLAQGTFNIARIKTNAINYFGLDFKFINNKWPFIFFNTTVGADYPLYFNGSEWTTSLPVTSAIGFSLLFLSIKKAIRKKKWGLLFLLVCAIIPSTLIILTFFYISYRYCGELIPCLICGIMAYWYLTLDEDKNTPLKTTSLIYLSLLLICSIWATFITAIMFNASFNWAAKAEWRQLSRDLLSTLGV